MNPIGGPPPARPDRVDGGELGRAKERAPRAIDTTKAARGTEPADRYVRRIAEAERVRAGSFDNEKVARLRALADRGACVPSPQRIAAALTEKSATESPPEGAKR